VGGAGIVTAVRVGICVGDRVDASWAVFKLGFQVGLVKLGCSRRGVQVVNFLVSIL
jgi:hypothetical protein